MIPELHLKRDREKSVKLRHPWIFSGAVQGATNHLTAGDVVHVIDASGNCVGTGHFYPGSIAVRLFAFERVNPTVAFWSDLFSQALELRSMLGLTGSRDTDAYRVVNAEGDQLPGLIVDRYGSAVVLQYHTLGMWRHREDFREVVNNSLHPTTVVDRSSFSNEAEDSDGTKPDAQSVQIHEHGVSFTVDIATGQKTGFFLDQRDNRQLVRTLARSRRVLNTFCYTGGFSAYAALGGAEMVDSVDSSHSAIELCRANMLANQVSCAHREIEADCMEFLREPSCRESQYDLIVLDPPAFAKHKSALEDAIRGYRRLNAMAFRAIAPNGLLCTFSCSQVVDRDEFKKVVFQAAAEVGRPVQILGYLSQPADHPISIYHPEGSYLKGLLLRVV